MSVRTDYLRHHGILGMKWGVRRYQNKDGSLTAAGKKRYSDGTGETDAEATKSKTNPQDSAEKQSLIQKHRSKLIQKYIDEGYSQMDAERLAKQRMQTEAVVAVVGTVAVAVVATKVATRIGEDYCDTVLKSGTTIQNIGADANATFKDRPFYAAITKTDKKAYGAMYPAEKFNMETRAGNPNPQIFNNQIVAKTDIKRASVNTSRKIFEETMRNDPQFRDDVIKTIKQTNYGTNIDNLVAKNSKKSVR